MRPLSPALGRVAAVLCALLLAWPATGAAEDPPFVDWTSLLPSLTDGFDPSSSNICVRGAERCVDAVIRDMDKRFDALADSCDHNAIFSLAYLRTTEEYKRTSLEPGFFEDRPFVNHEDAVFASYYFDAFDAWRGKRAGTVPEAWRIAFDAAAQHELPAAGDLYLGINAHVQRDLPFVLFRIGLVKPDGSSRKPDHDKVNVFLNRVTDGMMAEIARRFDPTIDDAELPTTVDNLLTFQIIPAWRELAWRNAERLANAPNDAERARVAQEIEVSAAEQAMAIRKLLAYPPLLGGGAARDAYCAAHHDD